MKYVISFYYGEAFIGNNSESYAKCTYTDILQDALKFKTENEARDFISKTFQVSSAVPTLSEYLRIYHIKIINEDELMIKDIIE